jgi:hypothetical protein
VLGLGPGHVAATTLHLLLAVKTAWDQTSKRNLVHLLTVVSIFFKEFKIKHLFGDQFEFEFEFLVYGPMNYVRLKLDHCPQM